MINFVACWLLQGTLIVSLIARRANPGGTPMMAYSEKLRPNCKRGTFSRLQVYKRVRISIVEVYKRVRKSVSFRSVKGPKGLFEGFLWQWKSRKNFAQDGASQDKTLLRNSLHPRGTDVFYPRLAFAKEPLVRISKKTFSLFKSVTGDHLGFLSVSV